MEVGEQLSFNDVAISLLLQLTYERQQQMATVNSRKATP
jgi:hypothetical protein